MVCMRSTIGKTPEASFLKERSHWGLGAAGCWLFVGVCGAFVLLRNSEL